MHALSLLVLLSLALPSFADDDKEYKPKSGAWSMHVPKEWQVEALPDTPKTRDVMKFVRPGPPRLVVSVALAAGKLPLKAFAESLREKYKKSGVRLENEDAFKIDGRMGWSYEAVLDEKDGTKERVRQYVVEAPRLVIVTAGAPDPWAKADADEVQRIVSTLKVLLHEGAPAAVEDKEYKPKSGAWSVRVPADWQAEELPDTDSLAARMQFVRTGPPRLEVHLRVSSNGAALEATCQRLREGFKKQGATLENETNGKLDGRATWTCERVISMQDGSKARVREYAVDAPQVVLITVGGPEPWAKEDADALMRIVSSFKVPTHESAPGPLEFEARDFLAGALRIEVPKGADSADETDDSVELDWNGRGLSFHAEFERTALPVDELAASRISPAGSSEEGDRSELAEKREAETANGKAIVQDVRWFRGKARVGTVVDVFRSVGKGQCAETLFLKQGDVPFDELKPLEEKLLKAELKPHFADPAQELPPLSQRLEKVVGGASLSVPKTWIQGKTEAPSNEPNGPQVLEAKVWGADRAMDLGIMVRAGKMKGGREAYEAWWRDSNTGTISNAKLSEPRLIKAGGLDAVVLESESGPEKDRWLHCNVLVFDEEGFVQVVSACPVALKGVYGGLAERVAETMSWGR